MKKVLVIIGSINSNSANWKLINYIKHNLDVPLEITMSTPIDSLPYFNADLTNGNLPKSVVNFHHQIINADAVIICSPEYIFSLPGVLKNAFEWCAATLIFSEKPVGLIPNS
jgi:chromate reductase, NAD(P)H dehydrogenase (quinone)